ncbi:hypothetical protein [Anabaena subtropica]|uniref:Uncharacterized protein n=1 Tax=Anabaena subtropica FACHB-260 TaxID=2692884 RepID=A0ABR8CL39_9NOST|nr:hypothetical protein [Anabaena subtropica]MBD2343937.1 hypothetical protein [Anabaena subtropica FACHB-260]
MREFLIQIESALNLNFYYLALMSTLVVPDIAGAITYSSKGSSHEQHYCKWFNEYVHDKTITSQECYLFRHKILHQGTSVIPGTRSFKEIAFIYTNFLPKNKKIYIHNVANEMNRNKILYIDIDIFCNSVIKGAYEWLNEFENTEQFRKNYSKFIKFHPEGLYPYAGLPVIASASSDEDT